MSSLFQLLESFYAREQARGVAFVGSGKQDVSFGSPVTSVLPLLSSNYGFTQLHLEDQWLSVYASYFGWGKLLIAQFGFQEDFPPPARPWLAFVRLAALTQRVLENPNEPSGPPGAAVPVLRPDPIGPHSRLRGADGPLENDHR